MVIWALTLFAKDMTGTAITSALIFLLYLHLDFGDAYPAHVMSPH